MRRLLLTTLMAGLGSPAIAREWRSADGQRTFEADFLGAKDDKVLLKGADGRAKPYAITAFSKKDQTFAKDAQAIAESAAKTGPQTFQITQILEGGWLCRLAGPRDPKSTAPLAFVGETFHCLATDPSQGSVSQVFENRLLFPAGGRTFYPLKAAPYPLRAFALTVTEAATAWRSVFDASGGDAAKQSPPVMEPEVEIITTRSLGLAVGKDGLVIVRTPALKDATQITIRVDGKEHPATLAGKDADTDLTLLKCAAPLEPVRMSAKKPLEIGQNVFALHLEFSTYAKDFQAEPVVTRGIISKQGRSTFHHDAALPEDSAGGFIIGDRGDVTGFFLNARTTGKNNARKDSASAEPKPDALTECVKTGALFAFLSKMPATTTMRSPASDAIEEIGKDLLKSGVLVVSTRELRKPRPLPVAGSAKPNSGGPATGWSLSSSGTRHNSQCRFYDAAKSCTATDGKPCKTCGG
jgi:S1-C subfamily serine protease